jgi:hypothetical protein
MLRTGFRAAFLAAMIAAGLFAGSIARPSEAVAGGGCENDLCKDGHCNTPQNGKTCDRTPWGCNEGPDCGPEVM